MRRTIQAKRFGIGVGAVVVVIALDIAHFLES